VHKADNLPQSCAAVMKSGNFNFLETSGPVQACNGTDLMFIYVNNMVNTCIYHQLPPTCFGVCYAIFSNTIALLTKKIVCVLHYSP